MLLSKRFLLTLIYFVWFCFRDPAMHLGLTEDFKGKKLHKLFAVSRHQQHHSFRCNSLYGRI